ncbi:MAG: cell division protein FtsQ/DivIB, partial [Coleofasciculus sp. C2-GNP5-27]
VHLGPDSSQLAEQLAVLDRMRQLPTQLQPSQIAYIDLKNPDRPVIQMKMASETPKPDHD